MHCNEVMRKPVASCRQSETVQQCAKLMSEKNVGIIPIVDASKHVVGVVTDRDLALRVVAKNKSLDTMVGDIMTKELVTCSPMHYLVDAEQRMAAKKKSRILVVDNNNHCVGIISLSDIASAEDKKRAGGLLRDIASRESNVSP